MKIRIPLNKPLYLVLQDYYAELKKLKQKRKKLEELIKNEENTLSKEEVKFYEDENITFNFLKKETSIWYRKFGWSFTNSEKLIIFGKNAQMNEILIKKYTFDNDIVFHADIHGAGFVVVKTDKLSVSDIKEIASISACFSKAWKAKLASVDVYYVKGSQVSKTPPSGQYITKGAFMIYGKREYVKNIPLKISIGINFNEYSFFVGSPTSAEKYCDVFWIIDPQGNDIEKLIKDIRKKLSLSIEKIKYFLEKYLPGKNIHIITKKTGKGETFPVFQ